MVEGGGLENRLAVQVTGVRIPLPPPNSSLIKSESMYKALKSVMVSGPFCFMLYEKNH